MIVAAEPAYSVEGFTPIHLEPRTRASIPERVRATLAELACCCACPGNYKVARLSNETKVCQTGCYTLVASAFPHFGEEDYLRGWQGSGTIFFSMCNLRCVFCLNWDITQRAQSLTPRTKPRKTWGCGGSTIPRPEWIVRDGADAQNPNERLDICP